MTLKAEELYPLSKEQYEYLRDSTARINVAHGPVRSGKNFIENLRMLMYLKSEPFGKERSDIAFCGTSKDAILRIFLRDLFELAGPGNYTYNRQNGSGTIFGRSFYSFGFRKADDYERLRGSTLGGALMTEGTLCHPEFFKELLARLTHEGSKLFIDTNPAGPHHWLYSDYMTNQKLIDAGKIRSFGFTFDSNLSLSEEYKDGLKAYYGPGSLWYQRMIQGLWVMGEGAIYGHHYRPERNSCEPEDLPKQFDCLWASMDYGTTNPFNLGVWGDVGQVSYLIDEYDHDSAKDGEKTNGQYLLDISKFLLDYSNFYSMPIQELIVDPSAASFKADLADNATQDEAHNLWRSLGIPVIDAENDVEPGIKTVANDLSLGYIVACTRAKRFHAEVGVYAWDPRAQARGEDKPLKENDHAMDMVRYGRHTRRSSYNPLAAWAA